MLYHDVSAEAAKTEHQIMLAEIATRGLLFPVTVVDGVPVYDGAVSYPAILRAVHNKLLERSEAVDVT